MSGQYTLDEAGDPVPCDDVIAWARWMQENNQRRRLALTDVPGGFQVSTVFMGLDHRFGGEGLPVLWETLVFFDGEDRPRRTLDDDGFARRYTSRAEALAGHEEIVEAMLARAEGSS